MFEILGCSIHVSQPRLLTHVWIVWSEPKPFENLGLINKQKHLHLTASCVNVSMSQSTSTSHIRLKQGLHALIIFKGA